MSLVKGLIKSAVAIKVAQVAQRELSKPENQRKIKEGFQKLQERAKRRLRRTPGRTPSDPGVNVGPLINPFGSSHHMVG